MPVEPWQAVRPGVPLPCSHSRATVLSLGFHRWTPGPQLAERPQVRQSVSPWTCQEALRAQTRAPGEGVSPTQPSPAPAGMQGCVCHRCRHSHSPPPMAQHACSQGSAFPRSRTPRAHLGAPSSNPGPDTQNNGWVCGQTVIHRCPRRVHTCANTHPHSQPFRTRPERAPQLSLTCPAHLWPLAPAQPASASPTCQGWGPAPSPTLHRCPGAATGSLWGRSLAPRHPLLWDIHWLWDRLIPNQAG